MRITSWNLLHGMAIPPSMGALAPSLRSAAALLGSDLFAFQEVDHFLERTNKSDQLLEIAQEIGAKDWAFAPTVVGTPGENWRKLSSRDQQIVAHSSNEVGSYGIGIVSKVRVLEWKRLDLGNSPIGMPLLVPRTGENNQSMESGVKDKITGVQFIYVTDEPRVALAAVLENGFTVINTHLSFVPGKNIAQLNRLKKWAQKIADETNTTPIILGDLNLPKNLPVMGSSWSSLAVQNTYPSWKPSIQFDYILAPKSVTGISSEHLQTINTGISDHLPLTAEVNKR
jgi:endonuclease/exonuclease/phosphatase family metal-dependent hydrolase